MISDHEIKVRGMEALVVKLGKAEASRFISLLLKKPADYTNWRHDLFDGMTFDEIAEDAERHWRAGHKKESVS